MRWFRWWFLRGPGLKWLILSIFIAIGWAVVGIPLSISGGAIVFTGFIKFILFFQLFERRTLRLLDPRQLADIVITPLEGRNLWPALIAPPIAVCFWLSVIEFAAVLAAEFTPFALWPHEWTDAVAGQQAEPLFAPVVRRIGLVATQLLRLPAKTLFWAAVAAFIAQATAPRGGTFRIAASLILAVVLIQIPQYVAMAGWTIKSPLADEAFTTILLVSLVEMAAAGAVYAAALFLLRSDMMMRRFHRFAAIH